MDYVTLACQLLGGVLGALLAGALLRGLTLGAPGNALAGIVGGALGALILAKYMTLSPASLPDGAVAAPAAVLVQVASGAAGGAVMMLLVGALLRPFNS